VDETIRSLTALGHEVDEVDWRPHGYAELFTTLWRASAARIGVESDRLHLVEPITAWLIRSGRALRARALAEALAAASVFERETIAAFAPYDAVLTPALAQPPRPIGWFDAEDAEMNFSQQVRYAPYSSFVNVAGLPAIVVPVSSDAHGHPVSVQLVGRPGGEHALLSIAAQLERSSEPRHPPGW
jgi:amidase